MRKDLTVKDVLYALEYMNDALIRTPIRDGKAEWRLRDSKAIVKDRVAEGVRDSRSTTSTMDMARQIITWGAK